MDDAAYSALVSAAFKRLLTALDRVDPDLVEADSTGDMVTITVPKSGEKVVVNTQRAVQQVWVAGRGQGIHFSFDHTQGLWLDDKQKGLELFGWVRTCVEQASGQTLAT